MDDQGRTLTKYAVLAVNAVPDEPYLLEAKRNEIEKYIYGRFFFLEKRATNEKIRDRQVFDLYFLVEEHYIDQIIPRLGSGLLWARRATREESAELGLRVAA